MVPRDRILLILWIPSIPCKSNTARLFSMFLSIVSVKCLQESTNISIPVSEIIPASKIPAAESMITKFGKRIVIAIVCFQCN